MKKAIYLLLPLLLALALRLYPTAISGMPFSTDAWPPIRNTELLIQNTPIALNAPIFDGYNNYWPINSIFGAIISQITSLPPIEVMRIVFPVIGAIAVLLLFTITKRLYNAKVASIAAIILGTNFAHAYFTAAVTKETYANPLYLTLILLFLLPNIGKQKQLLLFTITSIVLALTHHVTALITIFILTSIIIGNFINNTKKGIITKKTDLLLIIIPIASTLLYYMIFAQAGLTNPLTFNEWLSVAAYQILGLAAILYITRKPQTYRKMDLLIIAIAAVAIASICIMLSLTTTILPGFSPTVNAQLILFNLPYFIALPFLACGHDYQGSYKGTLTPLLWTAPLIVLIGYAIFSNTAASSILLIRTPNFLWAPMAILCAAGLYWLYQKTKTKHIQRLALSAVIAVVVIIAAINVYSMYASVSLQDRQMGYYWLYTKPEFQTGSYLNATLANSNQTIAGDIKIMCIMDDYYGLSINPYQGFNYLSGESKTPPTYLLTYEQMNKNGYALGPHGLDLPEDWTNKTSQMNYIYSNGYTNLYAGDKNP